MNSTLNNNATILEQQKWTTLSQTMQTNTYILLVCVFIFSCFHSRCAHIYKGRWTKSIALHMVPPNTGCLKWIPHSLMITNDQIFRHSGLDALAIILLVEMCLKLFSSKSNATCLHVSSHTSLRPGVATQGFWLPRSCV